MLKRFFLEKTDGENSFILSSVMLVFETTKACQQIIHTRTQFYTDEEVNIYFLYSNINDDFNLSYWTFKFIEYFIIEMWYSFTF